MAFLLHVKEDRRKGKHWVRLTQSYPRTRISERYEKAGYKVWVEEVVDVEALPWRVREGKRHGFIRIDRPRITNPQPPKYEKE